MQEIASPHFSSVCTDLCGVMWCGSRTDALQVSQVSQVHPCPWRRGRAHSNQDTTRVIMCMHLQCTVIFAIANQVNNESVHYVLSDYIAFLGPKKCSSLLERKEGETCMYFFYISCVPGCYTPTRSMTTSCPSTIATYSLPLFSARHESPSSQR